MKDIQDLLDELEDASYNRQNYKINGIRNRIDECLENIIKCNKELIRKEKEDTNELVKFYIEESGTYKITKVIDHRSYQEAMEEYEDWLSDEFSKVYIVLKPQDRVIYNVIEKIVE